MKQEIKRQMQSEDVKYLPPEIMLNILSRIPVQTVIRCKCVCKLWRDLLETHEFAKSHLSKSVPGLAVYLWDLKRYRIVEFVDEHRLNIVFSVDLPFISREYIVHSSANGLLFMCNHYWYDNPSDLFVCNPITREYIRLPSPLEAPSSRHVIHGFGVSKMSGEYKVVRMAVREADCQVYTVGTGSWRRIEFHDQLRSMGDRLGAFLNGNLHWLAYEGYYVDDLICCLDLETERFCTFSRPSPPRRRYCDNNYRILSVLGDYLCVCDTFVLRGMVFYIDIWLMKEYGDEKSWTNEFVIDTGYIDGDHCPIKVFKDGDMLMNWGSCTLLYYSSKSKTIEEVDLYGDNPIVGKRTSTTVYTPSFLTLKAFTMENVNSF